ncbi:MAG: DinB family protein [Acidobacteriota bacterium]|nr:DinB family protein [Acidobacteriota bacterium]
MTLSEMLLPEFEREMATTRRVIERVPDDKLDWQPHAKSMTMRGLTTHLSNIPSWAVHGIAKDSLDVAPQGVPVRATPVGSTEEALEAFDKNVTEARAAIASASDEQLAQGWSLLHNGQTIFTMPRAAVLRQFVLSHMIHHRAQLGVYLRLNDIPVPSVYGPSADEAIM